MISNGQFASAYPDDVSSQPPKFVLIGSEQHGNGNVKYRVGATVPVHSDRFFDDVRSFEELRKIVNTPLANGQVPMTQGNEHLHLYGWAHDNDQNRFAFHLVVENAPDGQIAANIAAMSGNASVGQLSGYLSHGASHFDPHGHVVPLSGISLNRPNSVSLHGFDGHEYLMDLHVDELVVDCGVIDRVGMEYTTQRQGDVVKVMPRGGSQEDPYGHQPIATLQPFDPRSRFAIDVPPIVLPRGVVAGHIGPLPASPSSTQSFADR